MDLQKPIINEEPQIISGEIIEVKQLPIIVEQLQKIKGQIEEQVKNVLALECTDETVKVVKSLRAGLNRDFKSLEERRKVVKQTVLKPYEQFELIYKDCVTNIYSDADRTLKSKIDEVEDVVRVKKRQEAFDYFKEYRQSKGIDFVEFEHVGLNITLSASVKSLKETVKSFIDKIAEDLELIAIQENSDEISYHYKRAGSNSFLNATKAITTVAEMKRILEETKKSKPQEDEKATAQAETVAKVDEVLAPPKAEEFAEVEKIYKLSFTVKGTKMQLKELKAFLENGGYDYE